MKTLLTSGLALAIMTSGAIAQTAAPTPPNAPAQSAIRSPLSIHRPRALIFVFKTETRLSTSSAPTMNR